MAQRTIAVEELEFGMFVAALDRPWTETPFMFQGFHLRSDRQLDALRKLCRKVTIDVERSEAPESRPPAPTFAIRGSTTYPETTAVEAEFKPAAVTYERTAEQLGELFKPLATPRGVLDGAQLKESVGKLTDSVVRNPDALLLVTRLREKSEQAHTRALQVSVYMLVFARFLQLTREQMELLGLLGLLQDVGKTRLPATLLEKKAPLTDEEAELAKRHVEYSAQILRETPAVPAELPDLALLHHERQDGTGYPRGLKGSQSGLYGSIAAIADTFDALTAPRAYAEPLSPSNALSYLYRERGKGFHADLVEQFIQCVGAFPVGSVVELNSGETGIVITQNLVRRLKPRVMVVLDANGVALRPQKILDLDKEPKVGPDETYRIRRTLEQGKLSVQPKDLLF